MSKSAKLPQGDTSWLVQDRFGLFIHWGLYSQGARHEWLMHKEQIPVEEYKRRYFKTFDPDLYDPAAWADAAAYAGMKYSVVTAKHHEGFCLWDSKFTNYKATNTPAGRDLLKPLTEAFRERGIRSGFYYSLLDWHHPDYIIDTCNGPYRNTDDKTRAEMNKGRDQKRYAAYMRDQVRELLTEFGQIDVLWFDFSFPNSEKPKDFTVGKGRYAWESEKLYKMLRELAPNVITTDRLDIPGVGDVTTPEQAQPREWIKLNGKRVVWEACQTMSGSWGYHRDEESWRSTGQLIRSLIDCVSKGGNLLLNVGPTGRGEFDYRALERLRGIGDWMRYHSRAIYGCTEAPDEFKVPDDCRLAYNPETRRLYVHIFAWPYGAIHLDNLKGKVEYGQLMHDASEVKLGIKHWQVLDIGFGEDTLTIELPQKTPPVEVPVIELFLK